MLLMQCHLLPFFPLLCTLAACLHCCHIFPLSCPESVSSGTVISGTTFGAIELPMSSAGGPSFSSLLRLLRKCGCMVLTHKRCRVLWGYKDI